MLLPLYTLYLSGINSYEVSYLSKDMTDYFLLPKDPASDDGAPNKNEIDLSY